jgi:hypothetical protein
MPECLSSGFRLFHRGFQVEVLRLMCRGCGVKFGKDNPHTRFRNHFLSRVHGHEWRPSYCCEGGGEDRIDPKNIISR